MLELVFLGTGGDCVAVNQRKTAGMILRTANTIVHVDPGPGALSELVNHRIDPRKLSAVLTTQDVFERAHDVPALRWAATLNGLEKRQLDALELDDVDVKAIKMQKGMAFVFQVADCSLLYTPVPDVSLPTADIIVMAGKPTKKFVSKLKPKLMILTHFGEDQLKQNPIYLARELSLLGPKVITAEDGLLVSPMDYSAIRKQKSLRFLKK